MGVTTHEWENNAKRILGKPVAVAVLALGLLGGLITSAAANETDAEAAPAEQHCVLTVSGVDADGFFVTDDEPVCYSSEAAVDAALGLDASTPSLRSMARSSAATYTIGRHYSGTSYTGSSITITGSVACGGGVWKPSGFWNNNIESSLHYCGGSPTRFYDSSSCSGSSLAIYASTSSLGWMNNRASCVRYG